MPCAPRGADQLATLLLLAERYCVVYETLTSSAEVVMSTTPLSAGSSLNPLVLLPKDVDGARGRQRRAV